MEQELYVPLRKSFFETSADLSPKEMRTLVLLLSYRDYFRIYEVEVAKKFNVSRQTIGSRFKGLMGKEYLRIHNDRWERTEKAIKYRAIIGGTIKNKNFTRFKVSFVLDEDLNDYEWLVLSVILSNIKEYKNFATDIREKLHIPESKRSTLTKVAQRLVEKELIVENKENGEVFAFPQESGIMKQRM
jgi:DNA-binding MarR family transcriptional regulator